MTGQNDQGSGGKTADEAPKNDYVITGDESEMEKAQKGAADAEKAGETQKKPSKDAEPADDEDDEDDGDDDDQADDGKPKRKRGGFQKKIARLEEEREYWRQQALGNAKKPAQQDDQPKKSEKRDDAKPDPKDFDDYDAYSEALTDWKVDQRLKQRDEERQTEAKKSEFRKSQETKAARYEAGIVEAKKIHEDFDEVIEDYDGPLTLGMQQALIDSEIGPQVAYFLASNRKEAERIGKMTSLVEINRAIAKIEAKIEAQQEGKGNADDEPKTTKSPPPINPVKGSSKSKKDPDDMSYEEYSKERAKRRGY